jgi:hypothetical protein
MTQGVHNLVDAIISGDSVAIDNAFNSEMAERIATNLDAMRETVAKNMFSEAACDSKKKMKEESCDDEDEKEMKEDFESSVELTEEEFEELQAYMQTEEFEQLDELSKDTLKSYIKGASQDLPRLGNTLGRLQTQGHLKNTEKKVGKAISNRYNGINKAADKLAK